MALPVRRRNRVSTPARWTADPGLLSFRDEIDRLFDDFFVGLEPLGATSSLARTAEFVPTIDVRDKDDALQVSAELPGMDEKDVEIELDDDILRISGEKKEEKEEEESGRTWRESSYGKFLREIPLPRDVDPDNVKAAFKKGRLDITIPKTGEAEGKRRKIDIASE